MKRTHTNNDLRIDNVGQTVCLKGWVQKKRDLGSLTFIDLRDRTGITQLAFDQDSDFKNIVTQIKNEYVLEVTGTVIERSSKNKEIPTGDIEIAVTHLNILNTAKQPPMIIRDETDALEELRLKYRYLDLRRPVLQNIFKLRHETAQAVRSFLNSEAFYEFETPILTKSTPEGARDYLVPSRINKHAFYALPQSPQIFKQLLMVGGFERYYQIAKCFRDEDLRSDRQPEFTQVDIETSFLDQEEILDISERLIKHVMKTVKGIEFNEPFPTMTYAEAMETYGTDKPDTRFGMKLIQLTDWAKETSFGVFTSNIEKGGIVKGICVKDGQTHYSNKDVDKLTEFVKKFNAKGLATLKVKEEGLSGGIKKFFTDDQQSSLIKMMDASANDLILIVSDKEEIVHQSLDQLRRRIAKELKLYSKDTYDFLWVVDWPMFEYKEDLKRYVSLHHPFTMVKPGYEDQLKDAPEKALASAYDLVVQGQELGGGSIRIHKESVQKAVFEVLGIDEATAKEKFGFLLEALSYGTPPHGGIAFGFDRLIMLLAQTENIRDVVAFPKTNSAQCLLTKAPGLVDDTLLKELHIKTLK
jgi:aspartyl-tRNA synthetase